MRWSVLLALVASGGCGGSVGGGAGGTTGGAGGISGGAGRSGSVATLTDFCLTAGQVTCNRIVQCDPSMGPVEDCLAFYTAVCPSIDCLATYIPTAAAMCIAAYQSASCEMILNLPRPALCDASCPAPP